MLIHVLLAALPGTFAAHAQNGQEMLAASLWISLSIQFSNMELRYLERFVCVQSLFIGEVDEKLETVLGGSAERRRELLHHRQNFAFRRKL
jgi:hypothetical protein